MSIKKPHLFGINPLCENVYYSFESQFLPYQKFVCGNIPRNDLVIIDQKKDTCLSSFEIKLTVLPDNATCDLEENKYGSELVIRPDTIVYLACSIIKKFGKREDLKDLINIEKAQTIDWTQGKYVLPHIKEIENAIVNVVKAKEIEQKPIIVQPIWKTEGKSPRLANNCLDVFVWSDFGMLNLFLPSKEEEIITISRHTRSMIWLYKMLLDYAIDGYFDCKNIIDELSYNTKNDKAFSTNGKRTQPLMKCEELEKPRINKNEIKNIILGGGQNLLKKEHVFKHFLKHLN